MRHLVTALVILYTVCFVRKISFSKMVIHTALCANQIFPTRPSTSPQGSVCACVWCYACRCTYNLL